MARLTTKDYFRTHDRLRKLWLQSPSVFAELTPTEQWQLHDFFVPDRDLSDLELLQYRQAVTAKRPSLPHQAGRALSRFWVTAAHAGMERVARAKAPVPAKRVSQRDRRLVVKALARPEPDAQKLARAFIYAARERAKEKLDD